MTPRSRETEDPLPRSTDPRLVDELTGLSNELHFQILFDFAFPAAARGISLALVLFEIEGFEAYRRRNGGEAATEAVRHFAAVLDGTSREMDVTARLHGPRFLSLLRDCNLSGALVYTDRVQRHARTVQKRYGLTIAMGVAAYEPGMEGPDDLLEEAKGALARSVAEGAGALHTSRDP